MSYEISLSKFLSRYAFLEGEDLKKITHDEVKKLFPEFKRSSFEEILDNPELLKSGKVVIVYDGKKKVPYYIPRVEKNTEEFMDFHRESVKERQIDDNVYDYSNMSIYELRCLLQRKFNSYRNQTSARKELDRRGVVLRKKYNRCEFKRKDYED